MGIVEGLKPFEGIVKGFDLTIHTNHLNIFYNKLPSQLMTEWTLLLENFHPKVKLIIGTDNDAVDCLSRNQTNIHEVNIEIWILRKSSYEEGGRYAYLYYVKDVENAEEEDENEEKSILPSSVFWLDSSVLT